jgi:thiazole/oxazole-forming peptide maturase SagC family component
MGRIQKITNRKCSKNRWKLPACNYDIAIRGENMTNYCFGFDVRCIITEENIIFRKGVWNTTDGMIPVSMFNDKESFINLIKKLSTGLLVNDTDIGNLDKADRKHFTAMVDNGFAINCSSNYTDRIVTIFTGQDYNIDIQSNNFQLITDNNYVIEQLDSLQETIGYSYSRMPLEMIGELKDINLLEKVNSLEYENKIKQYSMKITDDPMLIILAKPDIPLLRNINRLAVKQQPLFIGIVDAPFMIFLSVMPKITACWDCFEQRMMATIKDHVLYNKYVSIPHNSLLNPVYNLHITNLLHMGLQEVITWNAFQMSKMMGRVFFLYLPTLEFHFHDIHRISSCPTCGYLSREENISHNLALNTLITDYLNSGKE